MQVDNQTVNQAVTPGQVLTTDLSFMRGHGTFIQDNHLVASVAGTLTKINKLLSITPHKTRFNPDIGNIVIGRINGILDKKWKVDIHGRQDAILFLAGINLPDVMQRRKTDHDYHEMQNYFKVGDLLSAEVQGVNNGVTIHTRSLKYGKLRNGVLVVVDWLLIRKCKNHFLVVGNVDIILGMNGNIWVAKRSAVNVDEMYSDANCEMSSADREEIARVCNVIRVLGDKRVTIDESIIVYMLEAAAELSPLEILDHGEELVQFALDKAADAMQ